MSVPLLLVDAFTAAPFSGNPAAVCLLQRPATPDWMQSVAAEMQQSETAFVHPAGEAWSLRWFTPAVEVELCGHATLASAHAIWSRGLSSTDRPLEFETASGRLAARRERERQGEMIALDFPATPPRPAEPPPGLTDALGTTPVSVARARDHWVVEVADVEQLLAVEPDMRALASYDVVGVIVTAPGGSDGVDFSSRFFAPRVGIDEDPVTGSAHCTLCPFWSQRIGRSQLEAHQASARGGRLTVRLNGDRVELVGRAVTVLAGELNLDPG